MEVLSLVSHHDQHEGVMDGDCAVFTRTKPHGHDVVFTLSKYPIIGALY